MDKTQLSDDEIDKLLSGSSAFSDIVTIASNNKKSICTSCGQEYTVRLYEGLLFFDKNVCECDHCQLKKFDNKPLSDDVLEKLANYYITHNKTYMSPFPNFINKAEHKEAIEKRAEEILEKREKEREEEELRPFLEQSKEIIDSSIKESSSDMEFLQILIAKILKIINDKSSGNNFPKVFSI